MSTSNAPRSQSSDKTPEDFEYTADPRWKQAIAEYSDYATAQAAVDRLSDAGFAVERVAIVGYDLRVVERVLGRLTKTKAALRGAAAGAWFGLLIGLLFGLFAPGFGWLAIVAISVVAGAVWGALLSFISHLATGGRRDFASLETLEADRYEVQVEAPFAAEAARLLAGKPARPTA
ncbi:general stress protein [Corynebacterium efficiens]|uniref:general stress protein n=1 Tax=Corynebacterium efficiens TaxID=152794 RepID=UPI0002F69024|nr:general stress protein [Corynebacterium efficiens]